MLQAPDYTQNLLAAEPLDRSQGVLEGEIGNGTGTMVVGGSLEIVFEALAGLRIVVTCGEPDALLYDFNARMKVCNIKSQSSSDNSRMQWKT